MARFGGEWQNFGSASGRAFVCGYCGHQVSADRGFQRHRPSIGTDSPIRICPHCNRPTFFDDDDAQVPGPAFGSAVESVPPDVARLYEEARRSLTANAPTSATLALRKLLMNVAVTEGASANMRFVEYVDYLEANHFVPPGGRVWVDHIRSKGNEATHELPQTSLDDAKELLAFAEMLLKFIYEFPNRLAPPAP